MQRSAIIDMANYYVNNDVSMDDLAAKYNVSKTTVIRSFKGVTGLRLPSDLQAKVDAKKLKNWTEGKATNGNKGHITISKEKLISIANNLISGDYTLEEMAKSIGRPQSTLYNLLNEENLGKELYARLVSLYKNHKETRFYGKM